MFDIIFEDSFDQKSELKFETIWMGKILKNVLYKDVDRSNVMYLQKFKAPLKQVLIFTEKVNSGGG